MDDSISFVLDGRIIKINFEDSVGCTPTTTVLQYLRSLPNHRGVKEGCAEGDCGACTVVLGELGNDDKIRYRAVNSCLVFLPMIHGKQLITVENLKSPDGGLHPVQQAMVENNGTQCGFCTPGIVMSLFALAKSNAAATRPEIDDALTGNLCRCTGYQPIIEAATKVAKTKFEDHFDRNVAKIAGLLKSIAADSIRIDTGQQKYYRPVSLKEALQLRKEHPDAFLLCGATDIALQVTKQFRLLENIIDLSGIERLKEISENGEQISIGSAVNIEDMMAAARKHFPALHKMFRVYGSKQIRNLATLGGNIGTASPIGDSLPVLMAYDASIVLESVRGKRTVNLNQFFKGYRQTELQPDEIITEIMIPKLTNGAIVNSYKISKRKDLDISTLSGGFRLKLADDGIVSDIRLAYGGMAATTKRALKTENFLNGKPWSRETVEQAMQILDSEFTPLSDVRGSAEFREVAARNLLLKFWSETNTGI